MQLRAGVFKQGAEVEALGHHAREAHQAGEVAQVAVDAVADAGVLDLDRQIAAILGLGAVDLPDGGGGDGADVEFFEPFGKICTPGPCKHLFELRRGHEMRLCLQRAEHCGEFGGQQITCFQGEKLPHLHRGTAHLRKLTRQALGVCRGEEHVAGRRFAALKQRARAGCGGGGQ